MVSICICNLGLYNEGKLACSWIILPCTESKLQRLLWRIGINEVYEEWFICDSSSDLNCVNEVIGEHTSIHSLNRLAKRLRGMSKSELEMLEAVSEYESPRTADELLKLACNLDCYTIYPDVNTHEELGEYFLYELEAISVPEHLLPYFNAEAYGRDLSSILTLCVKCWLISSQPVKKGERIWTSRLRELPSVAKIHTVLQYLLVSMVRVSKSVIP